MSRVDEAMRRAAESRRGSNQQEPDLQLQPLVQGADVTDLASEPFPIEMPERRPSRTFPSVLAPFSPVMAEAPRAAPALPNLPKAGSLFERIDSSLAEKVVIDSNMLPASREQYRRLAAALHHAQAARGLKVVMIASAVPGEGKTLTAANLALTLSESYRRNVLLIDADLRRPTLHTVFRIDNADGLSEGLTSADERRLPVRQVSSGLAVLPAGQPNSDPMAGLTSDRMRRLLEEAREVFDWIIVDTPPLILLPDASLLGSMVDTAVFVVRAGSTPHDLVKRAVDSIGRARIIGTVLNGAEVANQAYSYSAFDKYYGSQSAGPEQT